jgi:hypothetical protein
MLHSLIAGLRTQTSNDGTQSQTRRRFARREHDRCVAVIHGQTFPVQDWSPGGVQIAGDERLFGLGGALDMTLKFKLRNTIIDVPVTGTTVRKTSGRVALSFGDIGQTVRRSFQQVIDDCIAAEFANSQA